MIFSDHQLRETIQGEIMIDEEMITITKKSYDELVANSRKLTALENAGVDNWEWYEIAMEELEDE
jgi:hypothetical protein